MTTLPEDFGVSVVQAGGNADVRPIGELDIATVAELNERLDAVIDAGTGDVAIELGSVTFLDSTGISALLTARQRLHSVDRRLTLRNPTKQAYRVLEVSGLLDLFDIESDVQPD